MYTTIYTTTTDQIRRSAGRPLDCMMQQSMQHGQTIQLLLHACLRTSCMLSPPSPPAHAWWSLPLHIHPTCETKYKGKTVVCGSSILCLDDRGGSHSFLLQECGKAVNSSVYKKGERVHSCLLTVYSNEDMLCRKFYS